MNLARTTTFLSNQRSRLFRFTPPPSTIFTCKPTQIPARARLSSSATMADQPTPNRRLQNPALFVCDLQEKFRNAIWQFDKIVLTSRKVLRAAQVLKIPVYVTTQNGAKLGAVVPEIQELVGDAAVTADKTRFSMMIPEIEPHFPHVLPPPSATTATTAAAAAGGTQEQQQQPREVVIVGIESHICVTQTALDLRARGHRVYVLADAVSSCNPQEVPLALARLRAEGVVVTTSESWLYECMGDARVPEFRDVARVVKDTGHDTRAALAGLLGSKI
ncbi:Isochorismatase hydrolase [Biscogniauxia mediterranea]|nr:Isochorismatase hydrolase [Biscogniauxia mediterranea]